MSYEKPQKGNPNQFVIQQHFHTAHCIGKFAGKNNKVEVRYIKSDLVEYKDKRAKLFCAQRCWDESSEKGLMAKIEHDFHNQINNIKPYDIRDHQAISQYFLLWRIRHYLYTSSEQELTLNGISGSNLTKCEEETIEKKWGMFSRENGVIPSRFISGLQIKIQLARQWHQVQHLKWGLLKATDGEFLVADSYRELTLMPISPKLAFYVGGKDSSINIQTLAKINQRSIESAINFYFAKKLDECPILS
ncbi:hypothetical protein GBN24_07895 [Plesiomonas shigelloides]|uniref:hypothetical protein n=1 Tax=Plesiomonas shigelloides TaxID=703 RepID=UPI001261DD47|nr:hypothetical protein [Plesiomonas shigelloides]KAB7690898.1 hypothetical protein GBN24_07895 [Plesiomonas shigelloides]